MPNSAFLPHPPLFRPATATNKNQLCTQPKHVSPTRRLITRSHAAPADTRTNYPPTTTSPHSKTFTHIIIGGGAAGCVLANRLSADPKTSVLLLEAGPPDDDFYLHVPLGFPYLLGSRHDWAFVTEPEPHLNGRRLYFPRGRVLGGSHAISVMLYHRGGASDYDSWGEGWRADDVLPYFLKAESQRAPDKMDSAAHGTQGPLAVSDLAQLNPMSKAFIDAAVDSGLDPNEDFNDWAKPQDGVGAFQVTQRDGARESPATAYMKDIQHRRNLTIETGATVERILFDGDRAIGVSFVDGAGKRNDARAGGEVILAAGVYASPQLLMLSGVGPAEQLKKFGIDVVADSPGVGQNLQDHPAAMLSFESKDPKVDKKRSSVYYTERTGKNLGTLLNYLFRGRGPLTSPMCEAGGFLRTEEEKEACDLQLRFIPFVSEPDPYHSLADFATAGGYLQNASNRPSGFTLQSVVARPRSRGWVELRSTDVRDSMRIHGNWMSDNKDLQTLIQGIKLCREIAQKPQFDGYRGRELYPGSALASDEEIERYVRETCHTANAMVGTCRLGDDEDSVVDRELRVRGVKGLRVIDSSVMPSLPGGQSGAPTMMIAEKGADLVREAARRAGTVAASSA